MNQDLGNCMEMLKKGASPTWLQYTGEFSRETIKQAHELIRKTKTGNQRKTF